MPMVHVNGIDVSYVDEGQGEALVLVHNLISSLHGFDFNIPVFSQYYRTIAYDLRGHGLSSKSETGYTFDIMAEDLYQLLTTLNVKSCYLVGQAAVGVGLIFTYFLHHPEMVKALLPVSATLLVGRPRAQGPLPADERRGASGVQYLREIARERGMLAVLAERRKTMTLWTPQILSNAEIWHRFEAMYQQTAVAAFLALPEVISAERHQEIAAQLSRHPVPVLLLAGVEYADQKQVMESLRSICPRFHALVLPDCGTYAAIENPQDFNRAVLNFLAGVRAYE